MGVLTSCSLSIIPMYYYFLVFFVVYKYGKSNSHRSVYFQTKRSLVHIQIFNSQTQKMFISHKWWSWRRQYIFIWIYILGTFSVTCAYPDTCARTLPAPSRASPRSRPLWSGSISTDTHSHTHTLTHCVNDNLD